MATIKEMMNDLEIEEYVTESSEDKSLYDAIQEMYDETSLISEICTIQIIQEGQNIDIAKSLFDNKSNFKYFIKSAKKNIKNGNISAAKSNLKMAQKCIDKFEKEIDRFDTDDVGSQVLGLIFGGITYFLNNIKILFPILGISFIAGNMLDSGLGDLFYGDIEKATTKISGAYIISNANLIASLAISIYKTVRRLQANVDRNKEKGQPLNMSIININYNECVKALQDMKKLLNKIETSLK